MSIRDVDVPTAPSQGPRRRRRPWAWLVVAAAALAVVIGGWFLGFGAGVFHPGGGHGLPSFPSLAAHPDPSLHGTVAWFAADTGCVRIVAASGSPSRSVYCIPPRDLAVRPQQGLKPAGPQLVWLSGGRLQVTMFLWSARHGGPPDYRPAWQRIVDVRTGAVRTVPAAQLPAAPLSAAGPTVTPDGRRLHTAFDALTGHAEVTLTEHGRTRTLLSVNGPGEYTYSFGPVFWAPGDRWIAVDESARILVLTPGPSPRTRVLVTGGGEGAGGGTAGPTFAVTGEDLLRTGA